MEDLQHMIKINTEQCCCCGACQSIRFTLPLIKSTGGCLYYEDPRPEDRAFVEKVILDCWASAISYADKLPD